MKLLLLLAPIVFTKELEFEQEFEHGVEQEFEHETEHCSFLSNNGSFFNVTHHNNTDDNLHNNTDDNLRNNTDDNLHSISTFTSTRTFENCLKRTTSTSRSNYPTQTTYKNNSNDNDDTFFLFFTFFMFLL